MTRRAAPPGRVRIIGGHWRGRRLEVPDRPGLRPTPDRVRETLFNWLAPRISGARCLDCFAGTGALSFEALSRGAAHCVLLEQDPATVARLHEQARVLDAAVAIHQVDARAWLRADTTRYDIIFVDPPFDSTLAEEACTLVANGRNLAPAGLLYVESARGWVPPAGLFEVRKQGCAGQVQYMLLAATNGDSE